MSDDDDTIEAAETVALVRFRGPWAGDDPHANFKADVELYTRLDPLETLGPLSDATGIPVGALVRYVLARWTAAGSESLLSAGPSVVERMWSTVVAAEEAGTSAARLDAYEVLAQMVSWLRTPLLDDRSPPG